MPRSSCDKKKLCQGTSKISREGEEQEKITKNHEIELKLAIYNAQNAKQQNSQVAAMDKQKATAPTIGVAFNNPDDLQIPEVEQKNVISYAEAHNISEQEALKALQLAANLKVINQQQKIRRENDDIK